jgi:hypothetical protein
VKGFLFALLITFSYSLVHSQQGKVWVTVGDSEFHQYYSINGGTLVSTDELFNQLIQKFSISVFRQALPSSRNKTRNWAKI